METITCVESVFSSRQSLLFLFIVEKTKRPAAKGAVLNRFFFFFRGEFRKNLRADFYRYNLQQQQQQMRNKRNAETQSVGVHFLRSNR